MPPPSSSHAAGTSRVADLVHRSGWRWALVLGWFSACAGLVAVATASQIVGKPVWWVSLDGPRWPHTAVALVVPVVALVAAARRVGWWCWAGWAGVASLVALAVADRVHSPGAAVATGVLALGALLLTAGSTLAATG